MKKCIKFLSYFFTILLFICFCTSATGCTNSPETNSAVTASIAGGAYVKAPSPAQTVTHFSFIGVTSDVHDNVTNLSMWLSKLKNTAPALDCMIFGGDYVGAGCASSCISTVSEAYANTVSILAKGNNEVRDKGNYSSGLVVNNSYYAVYVMDSSSESFTPADISNLKKSLKSVYTSKPFLIVSHCPLHYVSNRETKNASELIPILNNYYNAVFFWGHTHTVRDVNYGTVKTSGSTIQCSKHSSATAIKFTYANMGAMNQGNNEAYGLLGRV